MNYLEKSLKRFLKRKVNVTTAVVVSFLITGAIGYAEDQSLIQKSENTEVLLFLNGMFSKLENDKIKDIGGFKLGNTEVKPPVDIKPIEPKPDIPLTPLEPSKPVEKPEKPEEKPDIPLTPLEPSKPVEKPQENVNTENKVQENGIVFDIKEGESFINKGNITLKSDMKLIDENKDGIYETPGDISAVIQNNGGNVINEGNIRVEGMKEITRTGNIIKTGEGIGVYQNSGTFINKGEIYVAGNGYDMNNDGSVETSGGYGVYINGGIAKNEGLITSNPPYEIEAGLMPTFGIGMEARGGEIINEKGGIIENQYVSMYAIGKGTNAINNGTINTHNKGLMALDGATATNHGTINAWFEGTENFPAEEMIGLHASSYSGDKTTVTNSETGIVYGAVKVEGPAATVINYGTIHGTEIISMKGNIENHGIITGIETKPEGLVISSENGKFIQGVNGKLEADKVNGDIYLAGDYTKDNYLDEIKVNTDNISIKEHNGEIKSNSVMYNYNSEDKVLARKNFNEVVSNKAIANYLEDNYVDGDILRQEIYNNLKLIDNNTEFNRATNNLFGNDVYPNMTRQTMDMINFNKQVMIDNIFNVNTSKDLRLIGGMDYKNIDTKSSNLSGYDEDIKAVFFGADKALSETQRIGAVANVGTLESEYDMSNAKREDTFFQGNIYHTYNKNNFSLVNNLFAGVSSGDVERDIRFVDVEGHSEGSLDNKWIGLQNIASYRLDTDYFFFKPKLEANFTYLMQDSIKEDGNYGLEIEKSEKWSVEGGAGLEIGKDLYYNDYKVTLKAGANVYHEFANPYDGTDVKLRNISADTLKLADNENDTRKDLSLRLELQKNDSFGIYGEYKYLFDDENMFQVGMNYRF